MLRWSWPLCLALACTAVDRDVPAPKSAPKAQEPAREPQVPELPEGAPVTAIAIGRRMGKPPLRFYSLHLTLENHHDEPTWLLFAPYVDYRLPAADPPEASLVRFDGDARPHVPFGGQAYSQRENKVIEVRLNAGSGFHAYRLPPHARVVLDGVNLDGWSDVDRMDVWEVRDIRVNDRTPLEQWLPYPVTSPAEVTVRDFSSWENLAWDSERNRSREDYPKEVVTHVTVDVRRRWVIPLQGIEALGPTR